MSTKKESTLPPKTERQKLFAEYFGAPVTEVLPIVQTVQNRLLSNLNPDKASTHDIVFMAQFFEGFTAFAEDCA